ncbi:MAG TPA: TetR/AcrR family transcriptional regulator [Gallionellaceae bacterium]|nr:TetR/AcrR family transcriptional regulator [Gallionellaceae bacterium]
MNHPAPPPPGNRERLLLAARELFLEQGYDASVDAIIGRAGVARQTFYNHFQNKESLFVEAVRCCVADVIAPLHVNPGKVRDSLFAFALGYRKRALSAEGVAIYRTLISQAQRFPELIRELSGQGDGQMIGSLAAFLRQAMHDGQLRRADDVLAAELLLAMLLGQERNQRLLGVERPVLDEQTLVGQVIDGFLRMYAPERRTS